VDHVLGSPQETARRFLEYERIGVTEFIISVGRSRHRECFGREVLPLIKTDEPQISLDVSERRRGRHEDRAGDVARRDDEGGSRAALPDMEGWVRFARCAEEAGIESVLLSFSRYEPDTIFVACAVGQATRS
jgi:alkanesulfonate monooxygenase SsuD/methylene tetrahydromethanopterin reductase-like flavin-dependent oxidoreductase (luciferase family)